MDKITIERETLNAAMMALEYLLEASPVMTTKHRDAYSTAARLRAALAAQPAEPTMDTALRNATRRSAAVIHPGRLAAQPAEPVAWRWKERVNGMSDSDWTVTNVEPPDGVRVIAKEPLYAAQPAPAAVPPGYALVPIEPTHGMLSALTQEWHPSKHGPMKQRYRAMIAAAGDNT